MVEIIKNLTMLFMRCVMLFSQRKGLKPVKTVLQTDSMDNDLRTGLWNVLVLFYFDELRETGYLKKETKLDTLITFLWLNYFKWSYDLYNRDGGDTFTVLRDKFFKFKWYEVYDFIEAVVEYSESDRRNELFVVACNVVLEKELAAYRLVNGRFIESTSDVEIDTLTDAHENTSSLVNVQSHLKRSLELLTDRKASDYRNSIKESISAVEALCSLLCGNKTSLGDALKKIDEQVEIHGALKKALSALYGYTSDSGGIRHALMEESNIDFDDAKFMLVACSAFINYLIAKASKTNSLLK